MAAARRFFCRRLCFCGCDTGNNTRIKEKETGTSMITACVNLDLYRYEIHAMLKAFYPAEDVKVLFGEQRM